MSTLKVDAIRHNSATSDAITTHSDGTASAKIIDVAGGQLSNRNLCINGVDMMVAQRGTSTTGLQNSGGIFTIDRFSHRRDGAWSNAQFKHEQVDSGTGLFKKALKVTCTTAEGAAPTGAQSVMIGHYLESQDTIAAFGDGSAEAKSFTISFYVKASIATTYVSQITTHHLSTNVDIYKTFVVNSANTWERKTLTFPAITNSVGTLSGGVADNAMGYQIHWMLDAETGTKSLDTYQSGAGVYKFPAAVSTTSFSNTLNATFELGGVQIEVGTVATELEHRSYGEELSRCQRYFYSYIPSSSMWRDGYSDGNIYVKGQVSFPVTMRAQPSVTKVGTLTHSNNESGGDAASESPTTSINEATSIVRSGSGGRTYSFWSSLPNGVGFTFSAEL